MDRLLESTWSPVRITLRDSNGALQDVDNPPADGQTTTNCSAVVNDSAGVPVFSVSACKKVSQGVYEITVTASDATGKLDLYEVVWTVRISGNNEKRKTHFETIGGFFFTIAELRAHKLEFADPTKFPTPKIVTVRERAEELFESWCGVAFRRKGRRFVTNGSGTDTLLLRDLFPQKVIAGKIDGIALTQAEIDAVLLKDEGMAIRDEGVRWPAGVSNVELHYEHGFISTPEPVRQEAIVLAAYYLSPSAIPSRAKTITTSGGTFGVSTERHEGPTGIPSVDAVMTEFDYSLD